MAQYSDIISFWFEEIPQEKWYTKDSAFDAEIRDRFLPVLMQAKAGEFFSWRGNAEGRLAEIIVLDQFSRNLFRDHPDAFAQDAMALVLAQEAISGGFDQEVEPRKRSFFYLPFMHSESSVIHEQALQLYSQDGMENGLEWEKAHKVIIDRFGRYPHRNDILGRQSSSEELAFLKEDGSHF